MNSGAEKKVGGQIGVGYIIELGIRRNAGRKTKDTGGRGRIPALPESMTSRPERDRRIRDAIRGSPLLGHGL